MQGLDIPNVWIAVLAGVIFWAISQSLRGNEMIIGKSSMAGRLLSYLGIALLATGLYAGFRGPMTVGGITLERFSFTDAPARSSNEALSYAAAQLDIRRAPAATWQGASKSKLEYTVKNRGTRTVRRLLLRLGAADGSTVDVSLHGPFPPQKTVRTVVDVSDKVNRSYFLSGPAGGDVVGARF